MNIKSERFEMRLDRHILTRIDEWRDRQSGGVSRSEAIRRLIETALDAGERDQVRFSDGEKLMIAMMCDLFKQNGFKTDTDVDKISETIYGGHYWIPKWEMPGLFHDHADSPRAVRDVTDILDMWCFIEESWQVLDEDARAKVRTAVGRLGSDPKFAGFDGNNESEHMAIARTFVEKLDRWSEFKGREFNSHFPTVDRYRRMADLFQPMRATLIGRKLSEKELIDLLSA